MKRKSPPTEQSATKDTSAKRGRPSGTATEHATSGTATEHAALGPDIKDFRGPGKDLRFEIMFREACSKAPPNVERLLQEVKALGHYPQRYKHAATKGERDSNSLAKKLAKAKGHFTSEVQNFLEAMQAKRERAAATRTAAEHAQHAQSLMQQVRKLGHLPRESQSKPHEQVLARQLRDAKASGFLVAYEEELRHIAAADAKAVTMRLATERAREVTTLHQQIWACTDGRGDLSNPSAVARQVRKMSTDRRVLQSPVMQALVDEMQWMLARHTQQLRAERLAARAREKRRLRQAHQQELRSRCKRTMQQLSRSSLRCYCHDFAC
jgi:hypothetical protein